MGSRTTLDFGLRYPRMALSLTMIGLGSGGDPRDGEAFKRHAEARAKLYEEGGLAEALKLLKKAPNRVQLKRKNPRAFDDFCRRFMQHSAEGCAHITRRVMARRPSLFSLQKPLQEMKVPALCIAGDEDPGAVDASLFLKRVSPAVRLAVVPASGHLVNLEEPDLLHQISDDFFAEVETRKWRPRNT
jgi:3-oxoadipate enol-lactonase